MILVCDIETSSTDFWRGEILSMSIGLYSDDSTLIDELELKFRPVRNKFWSKEAEVIHKISWEEAQNFPFADDSWNELKAFLTLYIDKPIPFVCHALWFGKYFDRAFIECQLFLTNRTFEFRKFFSSSISTHTMAQKLKTAGKYDFGDSLSLSSLCTYFKIELNHHEAKSDREACAQLFFKLKDDYEKILEKQLREEAIREANESEEGYSHRTIPVKAPRKKSRKSSKVG